MAISVRICSRWLVLGLMLGCLGCSKGYELAPVSGRVELDHHPLAHATISFNPVGGKDLPGSTAMTDEHGNYSLKVADASRAPGAVVGQHAVAISANARDGMDKRSAVMHMRKLEQLPSRYNKDSELKFTVPAVGTSEANFLDLKSK